ncbi:hypothetical protein MMC19_007473 [Ptychographa xylographoides]|nr:hypothetical protein [Ptychographa xylographoides]
MTSIAELKEQASGYIQILIAYIPGSIKRLATPDSIRLIIIVGTYALLRPYLVKVGARFQAKDHERALDPDEMKSKATTSPNSLRGQVDIPDDTDSESEPEGKKGTDWGRKARRRQRKLVRNLLAADEKRRREEEEAESDKDIEEYLIEGEEWLAQTISGQKSAIDA